MEKKWNRDKYKNYWLLIVFFIIIIALVLFWGILRYDCFYRPPHSTIPQPSSEYDPVLGNMISQINESEIYHTTYDLQNFSTRKYPSSGNKQAADYLYNRLVSIKGLEVEYQDNAHKNIIASLPGKDNSSGMVFIVGAHYDSTSSDPEHAPGATDNACGDAIVLELARIMSGYTFNHTLQFAFWNAEETSSRGSNDYVTYAAKNSMDIPLYFNYDSSCYDPDNQYILDIMSDEETKPVAELLTHYNTLYGINFNLTYNVHTCISDHLSFRQCGYPVIMTHSQEHAPQIHTQNDTIDLVSPYFARKNAQLGMLVLSGMAEIQR
jgi:Zn-dependent M28 family amino/carboxypeptidase